MNHAPTPTPRTPPELASHAGLLWYVTSSGLLAGGEAGDCNEGTWVRANGALIEIPDGEHTAWLVDFILAGQPYNIDRINWGNPTATANLRSVLEAAPPHVAGSTDPWGRTYDEVSECWQVGVNLTGNSVVVMEFYGVGHDQVSRWVCGLLPRALETLSRATR